MRVLVTGATGYVGGRLVPRLLEAGHEVHALVRDARRVAGRTWSDLVTVHEGDLTDADSLAPLRGLRFDAAYYLVHGMAEAGGFEAREQAAARNFAAAVRTEHCVYLGGLQPKHGEPREHLRSRAEVGRVLAEALPTTEFRAGPIIGSGSTSFEMVRYLTERLPAMVTPRWVRNEVQPIAVRDVLRYLLAALDAGPVGVVDVGGEPVSFGDMMRRYARLRGLRRRILIPTPVLAPRLAARWVGFVTPIPNRLAVPIIDGVRTPLLADLGAARRNFPDIKPMGYDEAVALALRRVDADEVETRWSGAAATGGGVAASGAGTTPAATGYELHDAENRKQEVRAVVVDAPAGEVFAVVAGLGGDRGWPAWDWAWRARGALDRFVGGPGLGRGRRRQDLLLPGDAVDFWRVEAVEVPRLLRLAAEMRMPGRAWLEFRVEPLGDARSRLVQTALFEPKGVPGLAYWWSLYPVHRWLFRDLARAIRREAEARAARAAQAAQAVARTEGERGGDDAADAVTRPGRRSGGTPPSGRPR